MGVLIKLTAAITAERMIFGKVLNYLKAFCVVIQKKIMGQPKGRQVCLTLPVPLLELTCRPSNRHGAHDYKYPQNTSPALRLNEGHKLADFYSATTAIRSRFCGPLLLCVLHMMLTDATGDAQGVIWDG